jgi:hypothetical protein
MIFTGFLSLLQILFLPGLILNALVKKESGVIYRVCLIIAFSLLFNLLMVVILVSLHAYELIAVLSVLLVEIAAIFLLYRKSLFINVGNTLSSVLKRIKETLLHYFANNDTQNTTTGILRIIKMIALFLAILTLGWVIFEFINQIGSVFGYWDSVISYNRWATEWSKGLFPTGACEYPQLLTANWSLTYVFTHSQIVIFAKLVQGVFPLLLVLAMFDLGLSLGSAGFLFGVPLSLLLLKHFSVVSLFEGFMDVGVTTFILLSFYMILKDRLNNRYTQKTLWLSGIVILAAAMTKQPGALAFGAWVLINFFLELLKNPGKFWNSVKKILLPTLVFLILIASWYLFKMNRDALVGERSCIAITNSWAANDLVSGYGETLLYRLKLLNLWILFVPILIASVFIAKREIRLLLLCYGIPYLLTSFFYGYYGMFIRYLTPISFIFAIGTSVLFDFLLIKLLNLMKKIPFDRFQANLSRWSAPFSRLIKKVPLISVWVVFILGMLLFVLVGLKFPDSRLERNFEYQQMGIGNRDINNYLEEFYKDKDPKDLTLSWYPYINYLPGLEGRSILFEERNLELLNQYMSREDIRYILFDSYPTDLYDYLYGLIDTGQLRFITDFGLKHDSVLVEIIR